MLINTICSNCGKLINSGRGPDHVNYFCDRTCRRKYYELHPIIRQKVKDVEHVCKGCGNTFYTRPNSDRKFCNQQCYRIYIDKRRTNGETIYPKNWQGRIEECREKTGDTCPLCGYRKFSNMTFDVHHKIPPRYFITNPALAHEFDNLIAICKSCHRRIDRRLSPVIKT